ncbi:MAG: hypothetical protein ACRD3W_31110 [Terriglobales bacterium]
MQPSHCVQVLQPVVCERHSPELQLGGIDILARIELGGAVGGLPLGGWTLCSGWICRVYHLQTFELGDVAVGTFYEVPRHCRKRYGEHGKTRADHEPFPPAGGIGE